MKKTIFAVLLLGSLSACGTTDVIPRPVTLEGPSITKANQAAAAALILSSVSKIKNDDPILNATIVNIDNLEKSSTLGRLISEQINGAFAQSGYKMIELKLRESVYIKRNEGELMLSREISDLAASHKVQAVIVGTYAVAYNNVYINLKMVDSRTSYVMGVHDYTLPIDQNVRELLRIY